MPSATSGADVAGSGIAGHDPAASTASVLRRGLLGLSILATIGTTLELTLLRHWDSGLELIPFLALVGLGAAIVLVVYRPGARSIRLARGLAMAVLATGFVGVFVHVRANYEAAPLDFRYTDSWPATPEPIRCLLAATDTVGPSPTLAPAAIAFAALALLLATVRHPAIDSESVSPPRAPVV